MVISRASQRDSNRVVGRVGRSFASICRNMLLCLLDDVCECLVQLFHSEFLKLRIDSGAQEASVAKDFTRQSKKLQESGVVHGYSGMVWFVHKEDRQDI